MYYGKEEHRLFKWLDYIINPKYIKNIKKYLIKIAHDFLLFNFNLEQSH